MERNNCRLFGAFACCKPGWRGMFTLLFWLIVGALAGNVVMVVFNNCVGAEAALKYGTLISYPVMFFPPMWWAYRNSRNSAGAAPLELDRSNYAPYGMFSMCVLAVLAVLSLAFVMDFVTSLLPSMPDWLKKAMETLTQGNLWLNLICVGIMAPFFEEWLCRGMVLRGLLSNGVKPLWAIVASAAFFALIHLNPWQAIPAFTVGLLMGYVYWKTGSLKLTMLMHCANNVLAVLCSHVPEWKDMESWKDVMPSQTYRIVFICCAIILILCCRRFRRIETI